MTSSDLWPVADGGLLSSRTGRSLAVSAVLLLASERPAVLPGALLAAPVVAALTLLGAAAALKTAADFWIATALRRRAPMPLRGEACAAAGELSAVSPLLARCRIVPKREASFGAAPLSWWRWASSFSGNVCTRGSAWWHTWPWWQILKPAQEQATKIALASSALERGAYLSTLSWASHLGLLGDCIGTYCLHQAGEGPLLAFAQESLAPVVAHPTKPAGAHQTDAQLSLWTVKCKLRREASGAAALAGRHW